MKNLSIIAAIGKNNELGYKNRLIWDIKEDLQFFKKKTTNAYVVMGSKTYLSLPGKLKNRKYIILTLEPLEVDEDVLLFNDLEKLLEHIKLINEEIFIIGGGQIYKLFLPYASKMYLTEIDATEDGADTYFPEINNSEWKCIKGEQLEESNIKYSHNEYIRKN